MWYSVTPEGISARHGRIISRAFDFGIILDAFCGIGGDLIFLDGNIFSIATDISSDRIDTARRFHSQLGSNPVDFILSNSLTPCFRPGCFDAVYLSPPWGHRGITNRKQAPVFGNRRLNQLDLDGFSIFNKFSKFSKNLIFYLPRGMKPSELHLLRDTHGGDKWAVDVHLSTDPDDDTVTPEHKWKVRAITCYFGGKLVDTIQNLEN